MVDRGDMAPNVRVQTEDGSIIPLFEAISLPAVLYFYPKDDTTGCTREAQEFSALADDFAAAGVGIAGISKDSPKKHASFTKKYDLKLRLLTDADGSACEAFGCRVEKSMYGRSYMGIERSTFLIAADGRIGQVWRKVKVAEHAQAVLTEALAAKVP